MLMVICNFLVVSVTVRQGWGGGKGELLLPVLSTVDKYKTRTFQLLLW